MTGSAACITLSGWGQPHDALAAVAPQAKHFSYTDYTSAGQALSALAVQAKQADMLIGWSLGAQMIVRLVAAKMATPKRLVLIAPPFQFVENSHLALGMKPDLYAKFLDNYKRSPKRTLTKAWELVAKDDSNESAVRGYLEQQKNEQALSANWQYWLELLQDFSCEGLDLSGFPPTLIVHGDRDVVIGIEQSRHFAHGIANAKLVEMRGCGHAPHWHNTDTVARLIQEHADV